MTLYALIKGDEKHLVRAADENDARLLLVEKKQNMEWADDDASSCKPVFSSGRKEIVL